MTVKTQGIICIINDIRANTNTERDLRLGVILSLLLAGLDDTEISDVVEAYIEIVKK